MNFQHEARIGCPYCGEPLDILIDPSIDQQQYTEDCQVCCQPMVVHVMVGHDGTCDALARREDEV